MRTRQDILEKAIIRLAVYIEAGEWMGVESEIRGILSAHPTSPLHDSEEK